MGKRQHIILDRRSFLQLSGASLAACGISLTLSRPALAESADPETDVSDSLPTERQSDTNSESDLLRYIHTGALPFWIAGMFVNVWQRNLDFISLPPDLIKYYRRAGGASRDMAGAQEVWDTIPRESRMAGPNALRELRGSRDWSHFIPRSVGGSDSANAGIFEDSGLNRGRGAARMTGEEIGLARQALRSQALVHAIRLTARVTVTGALVGAVAAGVFAVMEYGLWFHEGKIDRGELFDLVWRELSVGTAVGISIVGIIAGLVILFPPLMAVMSSFALPLTFFHFAFVGYQFYKASEEWKKAGFEPLLGTWDATKEIAREAWERAAGLFEKFLSVSERALRDLGDLSEDALHGLGDFSDGAWQGLGGAPWSAIQGTRGIAVQTWQGVEGLPDGTLEGIGDFSAGAWQGAGSATQNAVQVTTETTKGAWEWVTVTGDGIAVDVTGVPEHVLDWFRDTVLPWLGDRVSPAVFWK